MQYTVNNINIYTLFIILQLMESTVDAFILINVIFQLFVLESYLYLNCTEYDVAIKHSCLFLYDINLFAIDTTKHSF